MIEIYTDASVCDNNMVATCFILTDTNFIGHNVIKKSNVSTSLEAEMEGAIAALEYAVSCNHVQHAKLYCDSISLLRLTQTNLAKTKNKQALLHLDRLLVLQRLLKVYDVTMELIQGHSKNHNPNKVVDLISNSVLRYNTKVGGSV